MLCGNHRNGRGNIRDAGPCHTLRLQSHMLQTRYSTSDRTQGQLYHNFIRKKCKTHCCNDHQGVIPAKGSDHTESHKTSQQHRCQRNAEKDSGNNGDSLAVGASHDAAYEDSETKIRTKVRGGRGGIKRIHETNRVWLFH